MLAALLLAAIVAAPIGSVTLFLPAQRRVTVSGTPTVTPGG